MARFDEYRVLCAVHQGELGLENINAALAALFTGATGADPGATWYAGRPVLVTRNTPMLGLFNGDIGITLPGEDGRLQVCFPTPDGTLKRLAPARLGPLQTAFALTVHKAQGSEFAHVALVLPPHENRVLTRELVYTALTRARTRITVFGNETIIRNAIQRATRRRSGLRDKLES
jgi:exodeoxyribonuclease V alpha subunit